MKMKQREMVLGVATFACLLAGATWLVAERMHTNYKAKKAEVEKLGQQISYHQNAIRMREEWRDELEALQKDLRVFDEGSRSVAPELMKIIKSVSSRHGLDITRSQPFPEKKTGDLFELGINCTWEGSLEAMVGFLAELQQQGVRYDVRTLNVSPVGKNTARLKGNMVIYCVYRRRADGA